MDCSYHLTQCPVSLEDPSKNIVLSTLSGWGYSDILTHGRKPSYALAGFDVVSPFASNVGLIFPWKLSFLLVCSYYISRLIVRIKVILTVSFRTAVVSWDSWSLTLG